MAPRCQLYLLTPPAIEPAAFAPVLASALDAGPVAAVQLRLKGMDDDGLRRAIDLLRPVAQSRDVAFLLNDRPDLVQATGCDGAHVGQGDMAAKQARRLLGPDLMLGVTCHDSRDLAMRAGEDGADYVAFGAFFPSETKQAGFRAEPGLLRWWAETMEPPCVAIGGITVDNAAPLVEAGADFLAVCGGVWGYPQGVVTAMRAFEDLLAEPAFVRDTSARGAGFPT